MSRTVNGEKLFGTKEQEILRKMLHQVAAFSGVEILTYAIMHNHFHVLVRVSKRAQEIDDSELLRRYKLLYPQATKYRPEDVEILEQILKIGGNDAQRLRAQLKTRMGDVSEFMRTLKQRFSIWFNKSHNRYGPLWSDRFKSVVVENDPAVVATVAAYIDLNPVRAGYVADPKDYRFCGYAEAIAGNTSLQAGMCAIISHQDTQQALAHYRMILFGKGTQPKKSGSGECIPEDVSRSVSAQSGQLSQHTQLLQRISFFTQGAVIGSQLFVDACIRQWSPKIGDIRPRSAHPINPESSTQITSFRRART